MSPITENANSDHDDDKISPKTYWRPVILVMLMLAIDATGYCMSLAPQTRMIEDIVCRQYYAALHFGAMPSENLCKTADVQQTVAELFGWAAFFDGIPGLALAMYYGALADKNGRRRVLFLSMVGQLLGMVWVLFVFRMELPLKLIWLSSVFLIAGGGSTVTAAVSMMLTGRGSLVFFYAQAVGIVGELLGPWMGSVLMGYSLWIPLLLALGCTAVTTAIAGSVPETLHLDKTGIREAKEAQKSHTASTPSRSLFRHTFSTLRFMVRNRSVLLVVTAFLVVDYSRQSLSLLLRYVSTRFSMPIARASLLLSFRAVLQLFVCFILLPLVDRLLVARMKLSPRLKDLNLARLSLVLIIACFILLFIAPGMWVIVVALVFYTLGSGFGSFSRSLVSSLVARDMTGTLFTTLSIMDTIGSLMAGPVVAKTFSWSLRLDGIWRGLPFVFSVVLSAFAALVLLQVRSGDVLAGEEVQAADEERSAFLVREESTTNRPS